jgi:hypothetical protein
MPIVLLFAATVVAASAAPDQLRPSRSSAAEITAYAVAKVCLPVIRDGAPFEATAKASGFPWKAIPGAYALNGTTPNVVRINGKSCHFRIDRGDPDPLRGVALEAVAAAGAPAIAPELFDSGVAGGGPLRQEAHCLKAANTAGEPLAMLISREVGNTPGPALQASIYPEPKRCAR